MALGRVGAGRGEVAGTLGLFEAAERSTGPVAQRLEVALARGDAKLVEPSAEARRAAVSAARPGAHREDAGAGAKIRALDRARTEAVHQDVGETGSRDEAQMRPAAGRRHLRSGQANRRLRATPAPEGEA